MQPVHVLKVEPVDECVEKAHFLGAAEAEDIGHFPIEKKLRHDEEQPLHLRTYRSKLSRVSHDDTAKGILRNGESARRAS